MGAAATVLQLCAESAAFGADKHMSKLNPASQGASQQACIRNRDSHILERACLHMHGCSVEIRAADELCCQRLCLLILRLAPAGNDARPILHASTCRDSVNLA